MQTHTQRVKLLFAALLFSTLVLVFPNFPVANSFDDGIQAYKAGDYKKALEILKPIAEKGNALAQYNLGVMYANGQGMPQDYTAAVKWYQTAAEQGLAGTPIALQGQVAAIDTRREATAGGLQIHPAADVAHRHGPVRADRRHVARQLSRDAELDLGQAVLEHRRHRRQMSSTRDLRFGIGDVDTGVLAIGERLDRPEFGPVRLRCPRVADRRLVFHGNLNGIG